MFCNSNEPSISVLMLTYNHERYIGEAIESVVAQEASFSFELVIGEDCSTDGTRDIVLQYRERYPEIIRPLLRASNLGPHQNFLQTLRACRGRYIALLEGDDYWILPQKLQKQVEALEARPDCAICASRARVVSEDGSREPWDYPLAERTIFSLEDLLRENFIPICTAVYRIGLLLEIPEWYPRLAFGDWVLHTLMAQQGDILLLPETMAVYRVHSEGLWATQNAASILRNRLEYYERFEGYLPARYRPLIGTLKAAVQAQLADTGEEPLRNPCA